MYIYKTAIIPNFGITPVLFILFFCLVTKEPNRACRQAGKQGFMPIWTVLNLGFASQS
jgi:hypothetical protein